LGHGGTSVLSPHTRKKVGTMDGAIRFWLGVDVSKLKLDVALLDERGRVKSKVQGFINW